MAEAKNFGPDNEISIASSGEMVVSLSGIGDTFEVSALTLPGEDVVPGVTWLANFVVKKLGRSSKYQIRLTNLPEGKKLVVYDVTQTPPVLKYSGTKTTVVLDAGDPAVGIN